MLLYDMLLYDIWCTCI